jgi:signal transduction histidine kinase
MNLFVRPPGDLLYYLTVFGVLQAALFMALGQRVRRRDDAAATRYLIASGGVLAAWALLMVGALFGLVSGQPANAILPPLERLAQSVALVALGWAFLTAESDIDERRANIIALGLIAAIILGYLITGVEWAGMATRADFNLTIYGVGWTFAAALIALSGMILMLITFRKVSDAPLKLVYFGVILIGSAITLIQIAQGTLIGDYAGLVRLTFVAALLLLPTLIYRMVINQFDSSLIVPTPRAPAPATLFQPIPRAAAIRTDAPDVPPAPPAPTSDRDNAQLMRALGMMLEKSTPENIPERIVAAAMNVLKTDVGALLTVQDANYADLSTGIDKVMNRTLTSISMNLEEQPTLVNAIERRIQRPLFPDRNDIELTDLYSRMDIEPIGATYLQPLVSEREMLGVLLIGNPYSQRELNESETELLRGVAIIAANLLALSNAARDITLRAESRIIQAMIQGVPPDEMEDDVVMASWQAMKVELEAARAQVNTLTGQITALRLELDDERSRLTSALGDTAEAQSISQRIVAMTNEQQTLVEERDKLALRLREAETTLAGAAPTDDAALKSLVDVLRREREELMEQRERLQQQVAEMRKSAALPMPNAVTDLLERMGYERARLESERDALQSKLVDMEVQLEALGVQGGAAGVTQMIGQLYEQRATLQAKYDTLKRERDALMGERAQLERAIQQEDERERQLQTLQTEVKHLASDREAITKQREKLRAERDDLLARVEALKEQQSRLAAEVSGYEQELIETHEEEADLRRRIQQLADARSEWASERDRLSAEKMALEVERDALLARVEGDRERLQQLGADGVGSLMAMIDDLTRQRSDLELRFNEAQTALAESDNQIERLQLRGRGAAQAAYRPDDPELLVGMVQEFRTPMTSIQGYIDLLLKESVGILGEMQRRFLQRVQTNVLRLGAMLDDLIKITMLDAGQYHLARESVDVVELIEDAITNATNPLREKSLTVNLDIDDDLPPVAADRDAIANIIGQLLTNAYLVSPPRTEITVTAQQQAANGVGAHLLVAFEDRGGGIAAEDQARVFGRKYRAENPLVQGLGDTGVGLAVAKALVEAHGGEMWLDSRANVGTTIAFTLPFESVAEKG